MALNIIGISAYYHDSACCLMRDGVLMGAAEEERFSRIKHDRGFPWHALRFCLEQGGITIGDIDAIAFYEQPMKKLSRQIWMAIHPHASEDIRKRALNLLDVQRFERDVREVAGYEGPIEFVEHHQAHAASSYYFSGFPEAAIMTFDGVGEWATSTFGSAEGHDITLFEEVHFPHSIGLLYSTITAYLGFEVNDGEYKVMGLAPYGEPRYVDQMSSLLELDEQGQYRLNLAYFDFLKTNRMYSDRLVELFGQAPRTPESDLLPFHQDIARSLQVVLEDVLLQKARYLHDRAPSTNLCMAGGVALNCVANGRILRQGPFSHLFVQPAASDAGGALGAAALAHVRLSGNKPRQGTLKDVYLGPSYEPDELHQLLATSGAMAEDYRGREEQLLEATVDRLAAGKVVGWFSGRLEFGPRALGARSILADPRDPDMRDRINALVKKRENFRPFAPAVLAERAADHFDLDHPSPFMLETCQVTSSLQMPAITHVDGSARVQTVDAQQHSRFAKLLECFEKRTGCPILLNTSFNVRGEPIVCTPLDALICFVRSQIDTLVLEDFILDRESIRPVWSRAVDYIPVTRRRAVSHEVYAML